MLLLVVEPDLQDRQDGVERGVVRVLDQSRNRPIHMGPVGGDFACIRARDEPPLRPLVPGSGGDVVGVEQEREALVERPVAGPVGPQQKLSRRTMSCARDATWSGSSPAWTG